MALLRELWQHRAPYGEIPAKLLWNISFSFLNRGHSAAYAARLEGEWEGEEEGNMLMERKRIEFSILLSEYGFYGEIAF